jgi:hypothetical protein
MVLVEMGMQMLYQPDVIDYLEGSVMAGQSLE